MAALTEFQKKMAARRGTSSIDKLARQYQEQIKNITGEYETSFADYTKKRAETMAPFESATEQYKKDYAAYEQNVAGYKTRLSDYQAKLEEISKNPYAPVSFYITHNDASPNFKDYVVSGVGRYRTDRLPSNVVEEWDGRGNVKLYKKREIAKFTEAAPTAPTQPTAPDIPEFDVKPFEEKKALAEQTFKRETSERKAARLSAVSRKERRPLLAGEA